MVYADTSVIVALLTLEPMTEAVTAWYTGLEKMPVSSDWLLTEFSSAISIKVRTGQLAAADAKVVHKEFHLLSSSGMRLAPVSRAAFQAAAGMAQVHKHGLRSGDSLHLAVAREIGVTAIATLDGMMAKNAKRLKIATVQF
ncbi:MAG: type II toxin-antitoxin system VapC family toxin [Gallionellaceae bacterium]